MNESDREQYRLAANRAATLLAAASRHDDLGPVINDLNIAPEEVGTLLLFLATTCWEYMLKASPNYDIAALKVEAIRRLGAP
ncbi:hypothetical protein LK459_18785 [Gordonia otitidis]|uniref:hypothetical protein n=1 Tax=Gordonia otitidis TaxID=249058 RepID=UPI001D14700A|nr:hypothetical protein [Gordonia otitidis]UEA58578.1 hypothetical protein LK459_18785 [Gordonia otitidis]